MSEQIALSEIIPSPFQKRKGFDEKSIRSLAEDIVNVGLLQPIIVRKIDKKYEIIAGERRFCAMKLINSGTIAAEICNADDTKAAAMHASENLQRENLTALEEADTIQALVEIATLDDAALLLGKSMSWVAKRAALLHLSPKWRKEYDKGESLSRWPVEALELISRMPVNVQDELSYLQHTNLSSVKELRKLIAEKMLKLSTAPWDIYSGNPVCNECPKRTGASPTLFDEINVNKNDQCLDSTCWNKKMEEFLYAKVKEKPATVLIKTDWNSSLRYDHPLIKKSLSPHEFTKATEKTKGAIPALVVSGPGAGSTIFIKKSEAVAAKTNNGGPKTMEEKRDGLNKRRMILFLDLCIKTIEDMVDKKHEFPYQTIVPLVSIFGAQATESPESAEEFRIVDQFERPVEEGNVVSLFACIAPKIIGALRAEQRLTKPTERAGDFLKNALGIFSDRLWDDAVAQIPEPKSWAREAAPAEVRACRECGCTESTPCIDPVSGDPCSWAEPDLCSACHEKAQKKTVKSSKQTKEKTPKGLINIEYLSTSYTYQGHKIFVDAGLGGEQFGTFRVSDGGSGRKRIVTQGMPMVNDRQEAQKNLDRFACYKKLSISAE
jgi:ParB/RepB/Spo0J family partition protein